MNWYANKNKLAGSFLFGVFVLTGTYNAVVINSESHLSGNEVRFVKRLDELHGVTIPGRQVAASVSWKKISPHKESVEKKIISRPVSQSVSLVTSAPLRSEEEAAPVAAVQEDLSLSLVEVINQKKWQNGLNQGQYSGSLTSNNGVIESLSVSLPNGEGLDVSFSEMTGNVFEYDVDGEVYSGMMYQVDQHAYMVTLTNGPLEGTRLRFSSTQSLEDQPQAIENNSSFDQTSMDVSNNTLSQEVQTQGYVPSEENNSAESVDPLAQADRQFQQEALAGQSYNLEQQAM